MKTTERQKFLHWMSRCEAIAGSAPYLLNSHPEAQVASLRETLKQAAVEGVEWRKIYEFIYKSWYSRRPHFPHPDAMAIHVDIGKESHYR